MKKKNGKKQKRDYRNCDQIMIFIKYKLSVSFFFLKFSPISFTL